MAAGAYGWPAAKIGSAKGEPAAKKIPFKPTTKQSYDKGGGGGSNKYPAKRAGMSGDTGGKRKASALARKEKK